jgi:hypothetical protein
LTVVWQRLAGRLVTGPLAFALGGLLEAGGYWRSRLFGAERRRRDAEQLAAREAQASP